MFERVFYRVFDYFSERLPQITQNRQSTFLWRRPRRRGGRVLVATQTRSIATNIDLNNSQRVLMTILTGPCLQAQPRLSQKKESIGKRIRPTQ